MPNLSDPHPVSLAPQFIEIRSVRFPWMFRLDAEGKCRLRHTDSEWRNWVKLHKNDWDERLNKLIAQSAEDYGQQAAWAMIKRIL